MAEGVVNFELKTSNADIETKIGYNSPIVIGQKITEELANPKPSEFIKPYTLTNKKPEEILKLAVKRMLPDGPLAKKQLSKLKMYKGKLHPHAVQNPKVVDFAALNSKNTILIS